ncbi:MAG: hypothetical protein WB626_12845 [Bacteroidota bacterium]
MRLLVVVIPLLVPASGCLNTGVLVAEDLERDASRDIVVSTRDGRTMLLHGGAYRIVDEGEHRVLRGRGHLYLSETRTETEETDVVIPAGDIRSIQVREKSPAYYGGLILIGGAAVGLLVLAFLLQGSRFGL